MSELKEGDKVYYKEGFWFDDNQILKVGRNSNGDLWLVGWDCGLFEGYRASLNDSHEWQDLKPYMKDPYSPSQQEVDMFNMLFGTQFTKEDLQFENINSSSSSD